MDGYEGKFATMTMAQSIDGSEYTDDRQKYVGRSGLLIFCPRKDDPEKMFLQFITMINDKEVAKFQTSSGIKLEASGAVQFTTKNSIYVFSAARDLTKEDKLKLMDLVGNKVTRISEN